MQGVTNRIQFIKIRFEWENPDREQGSSFDNEWFNGGKIFNTFKLNIIRLHFAVEFKSLAIEAQRCKNRMRIGLFENSIYGNYGSDGFSWAKTQSDCGILLRHSSLDDLCNYMACIAD